MWAISRRKLSNGDKTAKIEHGVVILASGATEHKPHSFGYGKSDKVMTQLELSGRLARNELNLPEKATHRDDPVRGAAHRRPPVLQQGLLHDRGQERSCFCESAIPRRGSWFCTAKCGPTGSAKRPTKRRATRAFLFVRYDENQPPVVDRRRRAHGQAF